MLCTFCRVAVVTVAVVAILFAQIVNHDDDFAGGTSSAGGEERSWLPSWLQYDDKTERLPSWFQYRVRTRVHDVLTKLAEATAPPQRRALKILHGHVSTEVAYHLVNLKIMDVLYDTPATCEEIGTRLKLSHQGTGLACRYLRIGAGLGLATEEEDGTFKLTAAGSFLASQHPRTLRFTALWYCNPWNIAARGRFGEFENLQADEPVSGYERAHGMPFWDLLRNETDLEAIFDGHIQGNVLSGAIVEDSPLLSPTTMFCDIGGGTGTLLATYLDRYPNATGILFEQADEIGEAQRSTAPLAPFHDRAAFALIDFFKPLPPKIMETCDVITLKSILHDWSDASALLILRNVIANAKPGTLVLIIDTLLGVDGIALERVKHVIDFYMLSSLQVGARERSFSDLKALLSQAGSLSDPVVYSTRSPLSIVQASVLPPKS